MVGEIQDFPDIKQKYSHIVEEEEDNDGHGKHDDKEPQSTIFSSATQIANTIMGAGILNLPLVMRCLGLPLGILFIVLIAIITIYSVHILLECSENSGRKGYSMFAKIIFGAKGSLFVKIVIIMNNFGLCCAYFNIFGSTCKSLVKGLISDPEDNSFFTHNYNNVFYILIIFLLMSFLIFKDSIDSLKKASFLGVLGITTFFLTFIFMFIYKSVNGLIPEITSDYLMPNGQTTEILSSLPTVFLAFTFQFNVFPIYLSLKSKKKSDMVKSCFLGVSFCLIIYLISGVIGLLMYGTSIKGSVLTLLEKDIEQYKESDNVILVSVIIINIAFLISSTMSIPLMFFSLKKNFINSIIFCKKKFVKKEISDKTVISTKDEKNDNYLSSDYDNEDQTDHKNERIKEKLLKTVDNENNNHSDLGHAEQNVRTNKNGSVDNNSKNIIIIGLYCLITACTILVPGLDTIFSIVGSTAANSISFILPNSFAIYLRPGKNVISRVLLFIGVIVLIVCLISEIIKIFVVNKH